MNKLIQLAILGLFSILTCRSISQPVIPLTQSPSSGDTFFLAVDQLPSGIRPLGPGPNQRWDFTSLLAPFSRQYLWRATDPAKPGLQTLLTQTESYKEALFHKTSTEIRLSEAFGNDPFGWSRKAKVHFSPAMVVRKFPLRYKDHTSQRFTMTVISAAGDLPNTILRKLPFQPDSIRLKVAVDRRTEVDAWGKLIIPGGIFDVLREKQSETRNIQVEAKVGNRKWQNISSIVSMKELFPHPNSLSYVFYSVNALEPVASVTMDLFDNSVSKVEFKVNDLQEIPLLTSPKADIFAYPNPAIVSVRLEFYNLPSGEYELSIYNLLGVPLIKKRYFVSGNRTEKLDISELRKGTYLYNLKDERGNTITTKRLIVIRP